jgi:hypothetical protein
MECHATGSLVPALRGGGGGVGVPGSSVSLSMSSSPGTFPPTGIKPFLPYMSFFTGHKTCHSLDISGKTTGPSPLVAVEPL